MAGASRLLLKTAGGRYVSNSAKLLSPIEVQHLRLRTI